MRKSGALAALSNEIVALVDRIVASTGRVEVFQLGANQAYGSGWLFAEGYWVTNHHVIEDSGPRVTITIRAESFDAELVGSDPDTDLAVLRTSGYAEIEALTTRARPAQLGELCFAFGAPLGEFADSVSSGIVSGLDRRMPSPSGRTIETMLQTDAAINHGNSGGPLVDAEGGVLGVNSCGFDQADNMGFAIPAHTVRAIAPELIEHGEVARATLGIGLEARVVGRNEELLVSSLGTSTAFELGDRICAINGQPVHARADLFRLMNRSMINVPIEVGVERHGSNITVGAIPARRPRP